MVTYIDNFLTNCALSGTRSTQNETDIEHFDPKIKPGKIMNPCSAERGRMRGLACATEFTGKTVLVSGACFK